MILILIILFGVSFQLSVKPYKSKPMNNSELFNSYTALCLLYLWLPLITGFLRPSIDYLIGWIIIGFLSFNITAHLGDIGI